MRLGLGALACVLLWCGATLAVEVSPYLAFASVPALGIHQVEHLRTSINLDEDLTRGYNQVADFKFEQSIPHFEKVAANASASAKLRAEAHTYLGYAWLNLRKPDKAKKHLGE